MIKKLLPKLIFTSIIILIPILVGLALWDRLPEQVPVHWDINGAVDGYAAKVQAVLAMPLLLVVFQWICAIGTSLDPKKKNINDKMFTLVLWIIPVTSLVCNSMVYATALGHQINVNVIMPLFMGALFIIIGNYLPKCKQSYTMGIKLPWTLENEENWNKTHRFAGFIWVVGGVIIMLSAIIGAFWIFFVLLIPMVVVPVVYSYLLYKKNKTE